MDEKCQGSSRLLYLIILQKGSDFNKLSDIHVQQALISLSGKNFLMQPFVLLIRIVYEGTFKAKEKQMRLSTEEAYGMFADNVFAAAFSVCRSKAESDDIVQDTFIKYHFGDTQFDSEEHIKAWLLRISVNKARDTVRSFRWKNVVAWEDYMNELQFVEPEDSSLFEAVMQLPDKYRIVVHLFYYEDMSIAEIAETLHTREGTVKSQLNRARKLLKTELTEVWNDD